VFSVSVRQASVQPFTGDFPQPVYDKLVTIQQRKCTAGVRHASDQPVVLLLRPNTDTS